MSMVDQLVKRDRQITEIGEFIVNALTHRQPVQTLQQWFSWCSLTASRLSVEPSRHPRSRSVGRAGSRCLFVGCSRCVDC